MRDWFLMKFVRRLLTCCFLSAGFYEIACAIPDIPKVNFNIKKSLNCGRFTAESPQSGENKNSLVLRFFDFEVSSQDINPAKKKCKLDVDVMVPNGLMFRPVQLFADGEYATSENGKARITMKYKWQGAEVIKKQKFPANRQDIFYLKTEFQGNWKLSQCSKKPEPHPVSGEFNLMAKHGEHDQNFSDIALFNAEQRVVLTSRWIWQWRFCNPWLNHEYTSHYTTPSGYWITGKTVLNGDEGFYTTDDGQSGDLYNITYSDNHQVAEGFWRFDNSATGWFRFNLLSGDGERFSGVWGSGNKIGQNQRGYWTGERREYD